MDGLLFNGAIFILAKVIKAVMQSAAEAECGALYMNANEAVPMRTTLEELGHPQPATPMRTDNSTAADGIMNRTVKQKATKSMDMRFYWLQDRVEQKQFWAPGNINLAANKFLHQGCVAWTQTHVNTLSNVLTEHSAPSKERVRQDIPRRVMNGADGHT